MTHVPSLRDALGDLAERRYGRRRRALRWSGAMVVPAVAAGVAAIVMTLPASDPEIPAATPIERSARPEAGAETVKRLSAHSALVTTRDIELRGIWRYEVSAPKIRLSQEAVAPHYTRLAISMTTRNTGTRDFDVSTTIDLVGDLRAHIRPGAFLDKDCPTGKARAGWCIVPLFGLPSENQPLADGKAIRRPYILDDNADELLDPAARASDVRVFAGNVRIG
jgi:hypothetical protein